MAVLSTLGSLLLGTKKRALLLAALAAITVYLWQEWSISSLEADLAESERRLEAAERNVREYAQAVAERNAKVEKAKARADRLAEQAGEAAKDVLEGGEQRQREREDDGGATGPEAMNKWLKQRF